MYHSSHVHGFDQKIISLKQIGENRIIQEPQLETLLAYMPRHIYE